MSNPQNNVSAYVAFNGQARQALEYYASVFGGEPRMTTWGEMGVPEMGPPEGIMHGQVEFENGYVLMASDSTRPGDEVVRGGMNLVLWGTDEQALRGYFDALAAEGTVSQPLEKQMWGDMYGDLTDKFGINWGFNVGVGSAGEPQG